MILGKQGHLSCVQYSVKGDNTQVGAKVIPCFKFYIAFLASIAILSEYIAAASIIQAVIWTKALG